MKNQIDTVIICAATEGFRMRPLTQYLPKVLLPIKNKPVIIYHLERAEKVGIKKAVITLDRRLGKMIEVSVKRGYKGKIKIHFIYQKPRMKDLESHWTFAGIAIYSPDFVNILEKNKRDV